jgi:hypothetical protein
MAASQTAYSSGADYIAHTPFNIQTDEAVMYNLMRDDFSQHDSGTHERKEYSRMRMADKSRRTLLRATSACSSARFAEHHHIGRGYMEPRSRATPHHARSHSPVPPTASALLKLSADLEL